jgi:hypothetical protein
MVLQLALVIPKSMLSGATRGWNRFSDKIMLKQVPP